MKSSVAISLVHAADWARPCRDIWAKSSPNPNVKIYVGAPASTTAAGSGYQDPATLATILKNTRNRFSSFGGELFRTSSRRPRPHARSRCHDVGRFAGVR